MTFTIRTNDDIRNDTIIYGTFREQAYDIATVWDRYLRKIVFAMIALGVIYNIALLEWRNWHGVFNGNLGG